MVGIILVGLEMCPSHREFWDFQFWDFHKVIAMDFDGPMNAKFKGHLFPNIQRCKISVFYGLLHSKSLSKC